MRFVFNWRMGDNYGEEGWVPNWIKSADPVTPAGIAHDICEHVGDQNDAAVAEIVAMGAMLATRGYYDPLAEGNGVLRIIRPPQGAMMEVARVLCSDEPWITPMKRTPSWTPFNEYIDEAMEHFAKTVRSEAESYGRDEEEQHEFLSRLMAQRDDVYRLLRLGALKMWERCGRSTYAPGDALMAVYEEAKKHFRKRGFMQLSNIEHGELEFQVCFRRAQVTSFHREMW